MPQKWVNPSGSRSFLLIRRCSFPQPERFSRTVDSCAADSCEVRGVRSARIELKYVRDEQRSTSQEDQANGRWPTESFRLRSPLAEKQPVDPAPRKPELPASLPRVFVASSIRQVLPVTTQIPHAEFSKGGQRQQCHWQRAALRSARSVPLASPRSMCDAIDPGSPRLPGAAAPLFPEPVPPPRDSEPGRSWEGNRMPDLPRLPPSTVQGRAEEWPDAPERATEEG